MSWRWILRDAADHPLRTTDGWDSKAEAEEWLGQHWRSLLDEGAESVSLVEDAHEEYTMGLREA
jgi:hypothetical protein